MPIQQATISPTANPALEQALRERVKQREALSGELGELGPLAVRLGLIQDSLTPRLREPVLALFAGDHGLALDGIPMRYGHTTRDLALLALNGQLPLAAFARAQGMSLRVVDCGVADKLGPHAQLMTRKIAHGTRNSRVGQAMTLENAHAAVRAGMEIADTLPGNVLACAGVGHGSEESAALVLAQLADVPVRDLVVSSADMPQDTLSKLTSVLQPPQLRHRDLSDAMEVLAAYGGFEIAVMVGAILVTASKRNVILIDGISACAALKVAACIAPPVTDYVLFCRSSGHRGIDGALATFHATALLELGLDTLDGTGATLAWPMLRSALAVLGDGSEAPQAGNGQSGSPFGDSLAQLQPG
ncbi:MAG: nicotinate-nucleotide--dimethylbenzimidazole phosphoribosyltransferase [Paucibacter sp.]|nr:nicotinate-nucleotide--dimethylbenzimidazole phosphoribosyltransferase [Roseateles sp.]